MRCFTWNTALCTPKYNIWLLLLFIAFILLFFVTYRVGLDVVLGVHFCFNGAVVIHQYCLQEKRAWTSARLHNMQLRPARGSTTAIHRFRDSLYFCESRTKLISIRVFIGQDSTSYTSRYQKGSPSLEAGGVGQRPAAKAGGSHHISSPFHPSGSVFPRTTQLYIQSSCVAFHVVGI